MLDLRNIYTHNIHSKQHFSELLHSSPAILASQLSFSCRKYWWWYLLPVSKCMFMSRFNSSCFPPSQSPYILYQSSYCLYYCWSWVEGEWFLTVDSIDGIEIVPSLENTLLNKQNNQYSSQDQNNQSDDMIEKERKECVCQIHRVSIACKKWVNEWMNGRTFTLCLSYRDWNNNEY